MTTAVTATVACGRCDHHDLDPVVVGQPLGGSSTTILRCPRCTTEWQAHLTLRPIGRDDTRGTFRPTTTKATA